MHTLNITFVMSPHVEAKFKDWLTESVSAALNSKPSSLNLTSRIQKVVEIGGKKPGQDHGLSIALQIDFPDKTAADNWADSHLPAILGSFMQQFGPNAAFFTTLLESSAFI